MNQATEQAPESGGITSKELDAALAPPLMSPAVDRRLCAALVRARVESGKPFRCVVIGRERHLPSPSDPWFTGYKVDELDERGFEDLIRIASTPLEVVLASRLKLVLQEMTELEKLVPRS